MSGPINLNKVRKDRARRDRRAQADENAVKFGRTKAERTRDAAEQTRKTTQLDQHKRET
ncbi:DUF4169 family protein [Sulfitobacter albidus]|uniref:DUF4169 family protein n=1 Tax=Sulfitobacter albidus TaxID=2829501 RepID=A0A975JFS1_9RHOB|nr:DUF4169 family protein [Sulfitobacter albidus]QUJ77709.1 DUF4169 family protein [Sulfitobacter albidus]